MALRPFVVYNYMAIRKAVAGAYNLDNTLRTVELPSCEDIEQALVWLRESLRKSAVKSSALVYEDKHAVHSSDVAGVRSIASHDVDEALRNADGAADEGFEIPEPLPCGHEDDEEEVLKKRSVGLSGPMAMSHVGLMNTGTGPDAVLEATLNATFDVLKVPRDEKPCSEFVGNGKRLMESFWYMFILGRGLEQFEGTISYAASRHLMLHCTNRFQRNSAFTLLLANQAQRHTVLRSVSAKVLPGSFSDVEELVRDPTFREQVEELMRHPRTASSKELLRKLLSLLNYCAKPSPWGAMERSACIAQLLAMMRRYGPASWFLTMAPDDVHSAQGFRLTLRINTNTSFPAIPEGFLSALQDFPSKFTSADGLFDFPLDEDFMQKQAAQNPASTTIMYQKIIRLIFGELLGVPAARHCGRTLPLRDRPRKLIGRGLAAFAVTEENGKGSHHSHSAVFGGAMPGLCTGAVEQQAVFDRLVEVLEAQVQADMPFELYVVSEARTVFNKFRGKKQYIDRPRVEWQEPPAILDDNGRLSEAFIRSANLTALRVQDHKVEPHPPTCHKGDDTGCRLGVYFVHPCKRTRAVNIRGLTFTCAKHGQGIIPSRNSFGKALLSPAELTCNPCVKPDAEPAELHPRKGCFPNGKSVLHVKSNDDGSASWLCISDAAKDAALERQLHQPADDAPVVPDDGDDPPSEEDDTNADDDPAVPAELARLIPREEKSSVVFEIKRPSIEWPAHEELQDVKKDMSDASVSEIFDRIWSGAASTEDIRSIEKELAQPEWADVKARFEDITLSEKRALLMAFSHLRCRNARLTCYNHILTAVLRCNTAPYLLGARESSRAAMFYLVKYMTKDSVKLSASLSTLIDAKEHIEKWVSTAEDSGESLRTLKHFLQRAINSYQAEVHDTQAVSLLMREPAHFSTELFESMASWEFVRTALRLHGLDESRWEAGLSVQRRPGGDDTLQEEEEREEEEEEIAAESKWTREQRESEMSGMGAPGGAGTYLDADGEVRIVPLSEHYRLRGPELQRFSPREYRSCVKVVQKSADEVAMFQARLEDGQEDITNRLCAGRRPNARVCCCTIPTHTEEPVKAQRPLVPPLDCLQFEFHPSHPLWGKWHQMLRSKLACVVHVGNPIPKEPLQLGAGKRVTELWLLRRERFAAFYMSTFVPWPQGELESDCTAPDVTPEAMLGWMAHNRSIAGGSAPSRERKISRGRLTELRHHAHALTMNVGQKKVFTQGRFRNRETWAPGGAGGGAGKGGSEGHQGDASIVDEAIDTLIAGQRSHIVDPEHCGNVARNETWALTLLGDLGISLPAAPIAGQQQQGSKVGSGASDLKRALLMAFSHLRCRNARLTCYNHILTAVLRCNTAPYLLGARESSRAAMFYLVKYMTKDSVKLSASLSTLIDAKEHIEKWVSTAEDSGESLRTLKHFLQRAINSYQAEVHDTQAVSLLMREPAHFSTELFESMASWEFVRTALRLHGLDESRWEAGLSVQRRPGGDDTLQEEEEREEEEEEIAAESKWTREQRESEMSGMGAPGGAGTYLDADGEVRIVPLSEHYRLRGPELQRFSPREYRSCVKVVQKSADEVAMFQARLEDGQEDITNRLCAGRRPNARVCCCTIPTHTEEPVKAQRPLVPPLDCLQFEFHPSHPLWGKWHQMLRSKLACVVHVGNPIPKEPLQLGAGKRVTELWLLRRERFAAFYMSTFVPWPQGELESDCTAPDVTPEAMLGWMAHNRSIAGGSAPSRERKISRGRLTELRHHAHALTMNVGQKKVFTQGRFRNRETWAPGGAGGGAGKGGSEGHQGDASIVDEAIDTLIAGQRSHIVDPEHCGNVARNETWALTLLGDLGISLPAAPIAGQQQQGSKVGSGASDLRRCGLLAGVDAKRAKEARARVHQELPVSAAPPSPAAPPVADSSTAGDGNRPTEDPPMPAEIGEVSDEQLEGMIAEWEAACEASKAADPDAPLPPPPLSQEQRLVCRRIVPTLFAISRVKRAGGSRRQYMQRVGKEHDRLFLLNGPAGAGKTEVVKLLHSTLSDMHIGTLVLTAFQGSAVVQLKDAVTTLTLFRFGRDASTKEESFDKNLSQDVRDRFAKYASASTLMVLVIDETSFIPPALLHHVDMRLQALLECDEPFGGLVIMLAGVSSSALAGVASSALLTHCGRVGACLTLVVSAGRRLPPEAPDLWQGTPPGPRRAGHRCQVSRQQLQEAQAEAEAERRPVGDWC